MKKLLCNKPICKTVSLVAAIGVVFLGMLVIASCDTTPTAKPIVIVVTATPKPITATPEPTETSIPTSTPTNTPEPTNTPLPTSTPLPRAEIWLMSLEDAYKMFYALGYSAEMYPTTEYPDGKDSWAVHFYDPSSFYSSDFWFWYGNSVYAWAEMPADPIIQISITKNFLDFPVSGIDGRADKFFRRILDDLGYQDSTIEEIMDVMTTQLAYAREDVGEILCYGRLETGEYISVWLEQSDYGYYWYSIDIRSIPICSDNSSSSSL